MVRTSLRVLAIALVASCTSSSLVLAWPHNPSTNVPVAVGSGLRKNQVGIPDGSGGAYLAWEDFRSGTGRIYAQHLLANGTVAAGWGANGTEVKGTSPLRTLTAPALASDGAGGVVVVWCEALNALDHDVVAQRLTAGGVALWAAGGITIAGSTYDQTAPQVVDDGTGSLDVAWQEDHSADGPPTGQDLYANRLGPNGALRWGATGVVLCSATGDQVSPAAVSDGAGGLDAAWIDHRVNNALFATRRDSTGALHAGWSANGNSFASGNYFFSPPMIAGNAVGGLVVVWSDDRGGLNTQDLFSAVLSGNGALLGSGTLCNAIGTQTPTNLVSDGADGAFVAWTDGRNGADVYALHVSSGGNPATGWPSQGLAIATGGSSQIASSITTDGVGGCVVAWSDDASSRPDVFATRLTASGAVAEGWSLSTAISTAVADQVSPVCVPDGASGAILVWKDNRNGTNYDLYAQNVDRWGQLGDASPGAVAVKDVLGDQGGQVRVSWSASVLDAGPAYSVSAYWLWRQVPAASAIADLRTGRARLLKAGDAPVAGPGRVLRTSLTGTLATYWEYVTSQPASALASYSVVAATTTDSTAASNPTTLFMIEARGSGHQAWDSAPAAGYSVDNLSPAAPAPFAASYAAGITQLHWTPPNAPDLGSYRLYRGSTSGFSPDPAHRIGTADDTTFTDTSGGFYYYRVTAVDLHGNEGPSSLAFPASTTGVGDPSAGLALALSGVEPNPVLASARIRWTLPRAERVRVTLVDLAGRRVRTLVDGVQPAGVNDARWDARDDAGRAVSGGIYFVRLEAEGRVLHARAAVIR